jgi:histidinol-phosphate aminotransferase
MTILPKLVVQKLEPYKGPMEGRLDYIRLDFGENTSDFPESYPQSLPPGWVSAYPEYSFLIKRLAAFLDLEPENIMLTNGSDEGIFVVANTFIEPGQDQAVVSKPCFVVMPHSLTLAGAKLIEVPVLPDLSFNLDGIARALEQKPKLAMFATPENPTGATLSYETILDWCHRFPETLFMIDEAYVEFACADSNSVLLKAAVNSSNLIVLRTFSKAWAMAGLRLGIVVGSRENLDWLNRVRLPFSVNAAAVWTALKLLDNNQAVLSTAKALAERKNKLVGDLGTRGYRVIDGRANSLLLSLGINAQKTTAYLQENGLLVRNRSASINPPTVDINNNADAGADVNPNATAGGDAATAKIDPLWGMVRISTGTQDENQRLLELLENFNNSFGLLFDLDGTLVDTSTSFDTTIGELVLRYGGNPVSSAELNNLRAEGGFNDDWVAAQELLRRRGITVALSELVPQAVELYLKLAPMAEKAFFEDSLLPRAAARHPLFIVTGRTRKEYEPIWGQRLAGAFKRIYCVDDLPDAAPKPAPDFLLRVKCDYDIADGIYIGNSVDDMQSARQAGMSAIGICTNLSADTLRAAGAQITLNSVNELTKVLSI